MQTWRIHQTWNKISGILQTIQQHLDFLLIENVDHGFNPVQYFVILKIVYTR